MNSNYLVKMLIAWFNDNKESKKERQFGFLFRGKESYNYLKGFPQLFDMLPLLVTTVVRLFLTSGMELKFSDTIMDERFVDL